MTPRVLLPFLLLAAFTLATRLGAWQDRSATAEMRSGNILAMLIGDSRRMFANHFFTKADAYFHSGYYPTIFDNREAYQTRHISGDAGAEQDRNVGDEHSFMAPPLDWIDRFNRQFIPSQHTHLDAMAPAESHGDGDEHVHSATSAHGHSAHDESGEEAGHAAEPAESTPGLEREMLPWLRFTVSLDPHRVEAYLVAAFWLRERMGKTREAEAFLREGLMENPDSSELAFELGRIAMEAHHDDAAARQMWASGLKRWDRAEGSKAEPDYFMRRQLLAYLALLEEKSGDYQAALSHLTEADSLPGGSGLYADRISRLQREAVLPPTVAAP